MANEDIADPMLEAAKKAGPLMEPDEVEELEEFVSFTQIMRETLQRYYSEEESDDK